MHPLTCQGVCQAAEKEEAETKTEEENKRDNSDDYSNYEEEEEGKKITCDTNDPLYFPLFALYQEKDICRVSAMIGPTSPSTPETNGQDDYEDDLMQELSKRDLTKHKMMCIDGDSIVGDRTIGMVAEILAKFTNITALYLRMRSTSTSYRR